MTALRFSALMAVLVLNGCSGALDTFYRPGAEVAKLERDMLTCEVDALEAAPVAFQVRQWPTSSFASSYYCTTPGYCFGGSWSSGVYSVDVNKNLRTRVTEQCMADKGYSPVTIPPCPEAIKERAPAGAVTKLPALSATSCVIRNDDGSFQIVNQG